MCAGSSVSVQGRISLSSGTRQSRFGDTSVSLREHIFERETLRSRFRNTSSRREHISRASGTHLREGNTSVSFRGHISLASGTISVLLRGHINFASGTHLGEGKTSLSLFGEGGGGGEDRSKYGLNAKTYPSQYDETLVTVRRHTVCAGHSGHSWGTNGLNETTHRSQLEDTTVSARHVGHSGGPLV